MDLAKLGIVVDPQGAIRPIATVRKSLADLGRDAGTAAGRIEGAFDNLKRQMFSLRSLATTVLAGFAFREVVGTAREFGQSLADLSAITGATGRDLEFLEQRSRELGRTTTLSASEVAEAFKLIASAKPDLLENVQALSQVTEEAIALSEAGGTTLPEAAAALGLSLNQFSAQSSEAGRFVNVLAAGAKFGAAEIFEASDSIKKSGVVAANAKISFEELNAAIQVLAQAGLKGNIAGTQLRGVLLSAMKAGKEFDPTVVGLSKALQNMSFLLNDTQKAMKVFGRENIAAAQILIGNVGLFDDLTKKLTGTNTAYEQQAIRVNTLDGDLKALHNAYKDVLIQIGHGNNVELRELIQNLTGIIRFTGEVGSDSLKMGRLMSEVFIRMEGIASKTFTALDIAWEQTLDSMADVAADFIDGEGTFGKIAKVLPGLGAILQVADVAQVDEALRGTVNETRLLGEEWAKIDADTEGRLADLNASYEDAAANIKAAADEQAKLDALFKSSEPPPAFKDTVQDIQELSEEEKRLQEKIEDTLKALKLQAETLGMNKVESELARLKMMGLNEEQLKTARTALEAVDAFEKQKKVMEEGKRVFEETRTPAELYEQTLEKLRELLRANAIDQDTFNRAVERSKEALKEAEEAAKKTNDVVEDLGMTFSSAFEDAIVNGERLRDVLEGIYKDVLRIVVRKSITEPVAEWISETLEKAAKAAASGSGGPFAKLLAMIFGSGSSSTPTAATAEVKGNAQVAGHAEVAGNAQVAGECKATGQVTASGDIFIYEETDIHIYGSVTIRASQVDVKGKSGDGDDMSEFLKIGMSMFGSGEGGGGSEAGFQHGGSFKVGGTGGPDSKLVKFWASPGEKVTVTPPGKDLMPSITVPINIDARGASAEAAATFWQLIPAVREEFRREIREVFTRGIMK